MGRTSKFSFPLPGRKRTSKSKEVAEPSLQPPRTPLSKAQRFLGTEADLNIDSPTRSEDGSWHVQRPASSGMSIAISESTDGDGRYSPNTESWDEESTVPPGNLRGKASSTLLGNRYNDTATETSSSSRALRSENSTSTLRSYYDRQKSPLSVSQQTSASSTRDLALRKGFPPVTNMPRSPLLQVDYANARAKNGSDTEGHLQVSKRKPARLDFSRLFPKARKEQGGSFVGEPLARSPYPASSTTETYGRKRLTKELPKSSIKSPPSSRPLMDRIYPSSSTLHSVLEDNEILSHQSPGIPAISASAAISTARNLQTPQIERSNPRGQRINSSYGSPVSENQFQLKDIPAMASPPWDAASATSKSSRNTRSSRRSIFSSSDLLNNSVLSLSSDSDSDVTPQKSALEPNQSISSHQARIKEPMAPKGKRASVSTTQEETPRKTKHRIASRSSTQDGKYLTIPLPIPGGSRLSGPWVVGTGTVSDTERDSFRRASTLSSVIDQKSQQPSPPLSPTSIESRGTTRSSRLMAVTKQEEALLEAMRMKRARMRERIIAEHETTKNPSSPPTKPTQAAPNQLQTEPKEKKTISRKLENTVKGKERILLYLDTPLAENYPIDTAEPSPDLSDFLSFGSDEDNDSTPRSSWVTSKGAPRPDSMVSPTEENSRTALNPPGALRLSAVGAAGVLANRDPVNGRKRTHGTLPLERER